MCVILRVYYILRKGKGEVFQLVGLKSEYWEVEVQGGGGGGGGGGEELEVDDGRSELRRSSCWRLVSRQELEVEEPAPPPLLLPSVPPPLLWLVVVPCGS